MNSLVLLIVCIAVLIVGYIFYGGWLCKQWGVGEKNDATPAHELEDGVDYVPAKAPVLMGHHFSSIAGAGPSQVLLVPLCLVGFLLYYGSSSVVFSSVVFMTLVHYLHPFVIKDSLSVKSSPQT